MEYGEYDGPLVNLIQDCTDLHFWPLSTLMLLYMSPWLWFRNHSRIGHVRHAVRCPQPLRPAASSYVVLAP